MTVARAYRRGSAHTLAKLTDADVRAIRTALTKRTGSFKALARQYGVDRNVIRRIYRGDAWRHLLRTTDATGQHSPVPSGSAKLTPSDVRMIRRAYAAGTTTYLALARAHAVSLSTIAKLVRYEIWA